MVSEKTIKNKITRFARARNEYYNTSRELEEALDEFTDHEAYKIVCFDEYCELRFTDLKSDILLKTINLPTVWQGETLKISIK